MKRYRTIVADPPWEIGEFPAGEAARGRGETASYATPYQTMMLDEIKALPVKELADNRDADAHLFLWTIAGYLRESYAVAEAWGFTPQYPLVWCKAPRGIAVGGRFASNVEFILYCKRVGYVSIDTRERRPDIAAVTARIGEVTRAAGLTTRDLNALVGSSDIASWWTSPLEQRCSIPKPEHWQTLKARVPELAELDAEVERLNGQKGMNRKPPTPMQGRVDTRWWLWPRGKHSEKPEAFLDIVEQVCPGPYLELFARRARFGWDYWGDESLGTAEMAA